MDGILNFFGSEAGQRRRAALNDLGRNIGYYIPPELRGLLGAAAEMTPTSTLERAARASQSMVAPNRTASERIGDLGTMLSETAGVVAPAMVANRAAMPAAEALQEGLLGFSVGAQDVGRAVVDRLNQPGEMPTLYSNPIGGRMNAADLGLRHPASRINLRMPVSEMQFGIQDVGSMQPARVIDIADLQNQYISPAFWDRTRADGLLTSIGDEELSAPVPLQGGADFMRTEGGIMASEPDAMTRKANALSRIAEETGETPLLAYTAMAAQAGDFSRMMSDAVMGQIRPSMANRIDPKAVEQYDNFVRSRIDKDWPGILSENASNYVAGMPGTRRRELWQAMDKTSYRDAGFPDVGMARIAITDPRLLDAQAFDTGLTIGRPDPSFEVTATPENIHATYGGRIGGEYVGGLLSNVPGEMVWRDFFNARRASGASPATDQRSFMMSPGVNQLIDQQMVDEISRYLERLQR
jgi:hypothetical protein